MLEADLRRWLKKIWGSPRGIMWIEPARGSSLGVPDVMLDVFGTEYWLPIELKMGKWNKHGYNLKFKIRPAQKRFHRIAFNEGRRTAFLVLVPDAIGNWCVHMVRGFDFNGEYASIVSRFDNTQFARQNLIEYPNDPKWWVGGGEECLGQSATLHQTQS